MTFWTFLLYLGAAIVLLSVGWGAFKFITALLGIGVLRAADGMKQARDSRATAKWEMIEARLDDKDGNE